jgi:hypothetical protein
VRRATSGMTVGDRGMATCRRISANSPPYRRRLSKMGPVHITFIYSGANPSLRALSRTGCRKPSAGARSCPTGKEHARSGSLRKS